MNWTEQLYSSSDPASSTQCASMVSHDPINLSPVCATADLFCALLSSLLHHLGSGQVQRNPHAERTCGK